MQQGCCDLFGVSVDKSLLARMNSEIEEPIELIHHGISNQRGSPPSLLENQPCSDEDGNSSIENQVRSPPTSCENSALEEPKTKKRRKQSNPSRYQTTPVMPMLENEDCGNVMEDSKNEALDLHTETSQESKPLESVENISKHRCHHCNCLFDNEDLLRVHIEEEHVQKILERQLQQQSYNKTTSGTNSSRDLVIYEPSKDSSKANETRAMVPVDQNQIGNNSQENLSKDSREFKSPHFPFPPMPPPFIPFSRSEDLKAGNLTVPLSMFPNPMAPFLFPVIPQGQTPPVSNGSSHSSQRIFNLEAYCELCNKEFCNKYFLKTHKANKHGIYSSDTMMSTPYGSPFLSPGLNSPIPIPHLLQPPTSEPLTPGRTGLINMESYCEICQKEFCNKYFLKKHKQKIHGIGDPIQNISPSSTPSTDAKSNSPVMATAAISHTTASGGSSEKGGIASDEGHDIPMTKMEFPSLFSLQNHKLPTSSSTAAIATVPPASISCSAPTSVVACMETHSPNAHQTSSNDSSVSHVFTPEKLREMGVINADAFCELCCKEFCNKYFLRTHKQNKHGINMPEITPGKSLSGSQSSLPSSQNQMSSSNDKHEFGCVENLPSDKPLPEGPHELSFEGFSGELSCEFCNRPFSSLYLLKMHKFYSHNIPYVKEESKSKPSSPTGCNSEASKVDFAKPLLPLPPPPVSSCENMSTSLHEDVASQDLQKLQSMIRELNASAGGESNKISCNLCRLEFDNKYFLRAHMMNEHGVLPNEDGHVPGHSNHSDFKVADEHPKMNLSNLSGVDSEAYCEICQKEFCSKYFLKTHKQNIHGIPLDMTSTPKKPNLIDEVSQIKTIVNNTISTSNVPCSTSSGNNSQASVPVGITSTAGTLANSSFSVSSITQNTPSSQPSASSGSQVSVLAAHPPNSLSFSSHMMPFPLDVVPHSSNVALTPTITHTSSVLFSSNSANMQMPNISHTSSNMHGSSTALVSNLPSAMQLSNIHSSSTHPLSPLDKPRNLTGRNYCNICNKELCNKYFMKTHMLKMHGINLDSQPHEAARISTIGGVQCDICQKELCSKYFLKVHKQNTHGIYEDPSQIKESPRENSTSEKEQPLQGLDLSDPGGRYFSHYPEICPICNCRFKSIKWLKAHMVSDHGNILKENMNHDSLLSSDSSITDSSCLCVLCGQGFGDKVALHVHLIKDHHSPTEELGTANNSGNKTSADSLALVVPEQARVNGNSSPASATLPANHPRPHPKHHVVGGSRIYHCSFCVYSTRWLSNLYAHEKRHTGVNAEGEKKFVCRVCHRAYRYNHSLQRHFLSHRAAGLNVKDLSHPLIISSTHQRLPQSINRPWSSQGKNDGSADGKAGSAHKIKRYRCSKCSKKFRTREMCLSHIHAVHSNKKTSNLMLQKNIKPFRCRFCGFATRVWNVLKIHITKQHHNDMEEPPKIEAEKVDGSLVVAQSTQETPTSTTAVSSGGGLVPGLPPPPPNSPHLPMTFAMPQNPPSAGSFIMQPFLLAQPESDGVPRNGIFVPSLVYLPVCQKISQPLTVAFSLTPA